MSPEPDEAYDVVVVGAGMVGSVLAKQLTGRGLRVLVLEAGVAQADSYAGYLGYLDTFYRALAKTPESPYPLNPDAPQPDVVGVAPESYFVQLGPQPFRSTYARALGGTMLHWMGTCLRMLPEDFQARTRFGVGRDWPLGYDDLRPYYEQAEYEIGVSADAGEQAYLGVEFGADYEFPMKRIPPSHLDRTLAAGIDGMTIDGGADGPITLQVRSTPAGRNSMPNGDYVPIGAVDPRPHGQDLARTLGQRCAGNSSCTPICPIQAKYNAVKTLMKADPRLVRVLAQAVASRVLVDPQSGAVTGIEYKRYEDPESPRHTVHTARGTRYVIACHAVETAKLMLASGLRSRSGLMGRNLMDHPVLLTWGIAPDPVGPYRGPVSTSGIEDARGGAFRADRAAFRVEIGNDGWSWPMGGPDSTVHDAVHVGNLFGRRLRDHVRHEGLRQFRFGFLMEQMPDAANAVSIDPQFRDQLGSFRPVIRYDLDDYVLRGMEEARAVASRFFQRLGAADRTDPAGSFVQTIGFRGQQFAWDGAGHFAGTHVMGTDPATSVVDADQRCWDHPNLFLAGPGSHPTMGTGNPTLTVAALAFRTADALARDLGATVPAPATGAGKAA